MYVYSTAGNAWGLEGMWRMVAYCRTITQLPVALSWHHDAEALHVSGPDASKLSMFSSVPHDCEDHDGRDISVMVARWY
jgi:hypothetical protein